jgi:hypothetical protein
MSIDISPSVKKNNQTENNSKKDKLKKESNRSKSDQKRDEKLYRYLLKLVDHDPKKPNISQTAERWGLSDNRVFVDRVIKSVKTESENISASPEETSNELEKSPVVPGITLNKLVHILVGINKYREKAITQQTEIKIPKILTRSEKLRALHLYANILPEEKDCLNLNEHDSQLLLRQLVEDITDPCKGLSTEKISEICRYISGCIDLEEDKLENYDIDFIIKSSIEKMGSEYFQHLKQDSLERLKDKIHTKVNNAINDIRYQNGSYQFSHFLDQDIENPSDNTNRTTEELKQQKQEIGIRFSPKKFIRRLAKSIIENQVLAEEFPIYMKHIEIQEIQQSRPQDQDGSSNNRLFAYTVKVHFYLENPEGTREDFYEEVTGIGSPLSHSIAAMNRALLWDIKSLKEYIPIAKQITFNTEIIGSSNNGSIWGHYVVGLCKRGNINYQVKDCPVEELASGDYCGFDTLEVYAKASFYARLRAIKKTGVSANTYITELQKKIKQVKILRDGENLLNNYPFSLEAMKSYLTKNLLYKHYDLDDNGLPLPNPTKNNLFWSLTEYEAHLSITEAYLKEGLYIIGKNYLNCIKERIEESTANPISKIIIARYYLCCFRYHYLSDLEEGDENSRNAAVEKANKDLDQVNQNLKDYVYKCNLIDELPHVNFYDFFTVMSKLSADRAKLYFFMSHYLSPRKNIHHSIKLFQEARDYAARSGNSSLYSMWSAYQCWCCLVAAYTEFRDQEKDYQKYINQAQEVLTYGLQSYQKTGKKHYESITLRSGKRNEIIPDNPGKVEIGYEEDYGDVKIQGIPLIKEFTEKDSDKFQVNYSSVDGSLTLNMSLLTSNLTSPPTLLFGTQSCMIIFALAMLKLCHYEYNDFPIVAKDEIETAKKMFSYSWSFAEDGIFQMNDKKMDRWNDNIEGILESMHLRGLYPHRITQFTDFGKIYFIVCELILLSQMSVEESKNRWSDIHKLLKTIKNNPLSARSKQTTQKKYNGHLQEHFDAIEKYVKAFQNYFTDTDFKRVSIIMVRDTVVKDIANILRTGQLQMPKFRNM